MACFSLSSFPSDSRLERRNVPTTQKEEAMMNIQRLIAAALAVAAFVAPLTVQADEVTDWNAIMQTTVGAGNANVQARSAAIVQLAVFEAVNSIVGDYEPYLGMTAPAGASPNAAAVAAAHTVLLTLYPASNAVLNAWLAVSLVQIPDGPAKAAGIAVGEEAAAAMLLLRANDGAATAGSVSTAPDMPRITTKLSSWATRTPDLPSVRKIGPLWHASSPCPLRSRFGIKPRAR
jgi:hypothetical protein